MEKEVAVAADVDEEVQLRKIFKFVNLLWIYGLIHDDTLEEAKNEDVDDKELSKIFKFVNRLWLHGLIDGETLQAARKISSQYQGYHEHEVSCGGEADLHRHYIRCQKNPGHLQFIPVQDFKMKHLPPSHRDKLIFDYIKAEADMICRLVVRYTSEKRPKYHPIRKHLLYPFSQYGGRPFIRTGTGYVTEVHKYTEKDRQTCQCKECTGPGIHTPKKVWGKVVIVTASHVVFDEDEVRHTTCYFGYDTKTTLLHRCLKLTGLIFDGSCIEADFCIMEYITHDMEIFNKLYSRDNQRDDVLVKLRAKYGYNKKPGLDGPGPVVIISHPHGCSKHVTVGRWTDRQLWSDFYKYEGDDWEANVVETSITYNAHTCPGSSGAPVIRLSAEWWEMWTFHFHSEAGEGNTNNNKSVVSRELVSRFTRFKKK